MAINSSSKMEWADIEALFTDLETARAKFFPNQSAITPEKGGQYEIILAELAELLKNHIDSFKSNGYVGDIANTGVIPPDVGQIIDTSIFQRFSDVIDRINDTCAHDSSYDSSYYSGNNNSYRGTYDSSEDSSYRGSYNSSNNSSHRDYTNDNTSWCSSYRYQG